MNSIRLNKRLLKSNFLFLFLLFGCAKETSTSKIEKIFQSIQANQYILLSNILPFQFQEVCVLTPYLDKTKNLKVDAFLKKQNFISSEGDLNLIFINREHIEIKHINININFSSTDDDKLKDICGSSKNFYIKKTETFDKYYNKTRVSFAFGSKGI